MDPEASDRPGRHSDVASDIGSHRRMARVIHSRTGATHSEGVDTRGLVRKKKKRKI